MRHIALGHTIVVYAANIKLEAAAIEKQRKTFLQLMKATEQVATYLDAKMVHDAVTKFLNDYEHLVYKTIVPNIEDAFAEKPYDPEVGLIDLKATWTKKLKQDCWPLVTIGFPLQIDQHHTEQDSLKRFLDKRKSYVADARKKARIAWNALQEYIKIADAPTAKVIPESQDNVHGFSVTWVGDFDRERAQDFAEALKLYKERAQKVMPTLLAHKLPMIAHFKADRLDQGGSYEQDRITINLFWKNTVKELVHVVAHEHAHHVYEQYLSDADQKYWSAAISGSYGSLKLSEIIKKWPDSLKDRGVYNLGGHLHETDPIFSLQIDILSHGHQGNSGPIIDFRNREQAENLVATEGDKVYPVTKFPISAYSSKNSEEAFCETLGLLVAYGPRAVHPMALEWLRTILTTGLTIAKIKGI